MLDNLWRLVFCRSVSQSAPTATRVFFVSKFLHYTFDLLLCVQNRRRRRRRRWRWWWNSGRASSRHGWCRIRPDIRHLKHAPTCRFPRISSCVATITHCLRPSLAQLFSTSNRQPRERDRLCARGLLLLLLRWQRQQSNCCVIFSFSLYMMSDNKLYLMGQLALVVCPLLLLSSVGPSSAQGLASKSSEYLRLSFCSSIYISRTL